MAEQASLDGGPYTVAASTTEHHVVLDGAGYSVVHCNVEADLTAGTDPVFISNAPGITASGANGAKFVLLGGYAIDIPKEWRALYFKLAAGAATAPILSILPVRGKVGT